MREKERSLQERNSTEVKELEDLLGPDDVDVDFKRILEEARDEKGCAIFETLSIDGPSEFVVVSRSRWDKHQRKWNALWRLNSSASASDGWWQEGLEQQSWMELGGKKGLWMQRQITSEKQDHFVANRKRWFESKGKNGAQQESVEWHDIEYQGEIAKAPPCPERTLKTALPQQSPPSFREEEKHWVAMEDRRRQSIAFEKMARRMLKYLEDSDDVKVGITELHSGRKHIKWWCAICGEQYDWKQPNRLLVVQTGESFEQAKVFKAHSVPHGLCENLINALKLLANQQEDGDGLLQSIVTNLGVRSRNGLTQGLREFIKIDNQQCPEVTVRESPELTLQAEEVGTLKTYINVNHIEKGDEALPWLMLTGVLSVRRCVKEIEEEDRGEMYEAHKEMSRAVGVKKPQEAQKAKALWKMKAAKEAEKNTTTPRMKTTSGGEMRQD